jgi:hypothetical protein
LNRTYYYRNTDERLAGLDSECRYWVQNGDTVLAEMPLSIYPGKSEKQKDKYVLQSVHNYHLKYVLSEQGWNLEPFVDGTGLSSRRADFSAGAGRKKIVMEVELGNKARIDSALVKFQSAWHAGILKLAILVVPVNRLAAITDSGLATFEPAVQYLEGLPKGMVPFPLIVIGLDTDASTPVLDWSTTRVGSAKNLSGNNDKSVLAHAVSEYHAGVVFTEIALPTTDAEKQEAKLLSKRLNEPSVTLTTELSILAEVAQVLRHKARAIASWGAGALERPQASYSICGMPLAI